MINSGANFPFMNALPSLKSFLFQFIGILDILIILTMLEKEKRTNLREGVFMIVNYFKFMNGYHAIQ